MARMIAGYMAASADGYVADREHGVGWLDPFQGVDTGYQAFIDGIATVVLGRATYDQVIGFGIGWPYPGKRGFVVTSRPLADAPDGVAAWHGGVDGLAQVLTAEAGTPGSWAGRHFSRRSSRRGD